MQLYYQGTEITDDVNIISAMHKDVSDGRCDCLELVLDHAASWYRWGPQQDDAIELVDGMYSTGELYLNTVAPEGDRFRIIATAGKSGARRKAWKSYAGKTLQEIVRQCAAESNMESRIYGINPGYVYPYLLREDEGCASFLGRIAHMEGAVLKTISGRYTLIGVEAAQSIAANTTIELDVKQKGVTYARRENTKYASMTVKTPYAMATAHDENVAHGEDSVLCALPAMDNATAGRWARGMLLMNNRRAETLSIESEFNVGFTAMARIDIDSSTDAAGEWIVDEAEHDFVNRRSHARLLRCIRTVM